MLVLAQSLIQMIGLVVVHGWIQRWTDLKVSKILPPKDHLKRIFGTK